MRIVIVSGMYPPAGGGAERATALLARGLIRLGHEVRVITTAPAAGTETVDGAVVERLAPRRAWIGEVLTWPFARRVRWNLEELADRRQTAATMRAVAAAQPDLVISANVKGFGGGLPRALAALSAPHVHVAHDFEPVEPVLLGVHDAADRLRNRAWSELSRRRWGSPDVVVYPSEWLRALLGSHRMFAGSRQVVMPNPVDVTGVGAGLAPDLTGRPQGSPLHGQLFRLLFIGQLAAHKGPLWAADALASSAFREWTLDVVGDGPDRAALAALAARDSRIRVHGPLSGAALEERWAQADALIVPSRCLENAPLVIFEAAARRLPVVAADVGGIPEFVLPGENGWRFAAVDPQAFLFAVRTAADAGERSALRWHKLPPLLSPEQYARELLTHLPQAPHEVGFLCPACKTQLVGGNCLRCNRSYMRDDIPVLHPPGMSEFKVAEAAYHDGATEDAADVHQLDTLRNRSAHERIFAHLRPVAPGGWLLELAGGSGVDAAAALGRGLRVIETDISPGAVVHAERQLAAVPRSAGRFRAAAVDAETIPLPDAALAGAWMTASFHHAEHPEAVLREVRRVLAPGARFVAAIEPHRLYFGALNALKPALDWLLGKRVDKSVADEEHSGFWRGELRDLFQKNSFNDVRVEPVWFLTGFLHYALEFAHRLLQTKKRLRVPEALERPLLAIDAVIFRLPGGAHLAWHWTASGRKIS